MASCERGAALGEFLSDFCFAFEDQKRMGEGVIADDVAGFDDFAGEFRTLLDVASDQKKSRLYAVFGEDFEQAQRVRVVGAVVIGQRDLARAARQAGESFAQPLSGRGHGLVAGGNRGCGGDAGAERRGRACRDCIALSDWVIGD